MDILNRLMRRKKPVNRLKGAAKVRFSGEVEMDGRGYMSEAQRKMIQVLWLPVRGIIPMLNFIPSIKIP